MVTELEWRSRREDIGTLCASRGTERPVEPARGPSPLLSPASLGLQKGPVPSPSPELPANVLLYLHLLLGIQNPQHSFMGSRGPL
jgi:hypothetical protein